LTLKAVGSAGTDIPFVVQNSAGTLNLFQVSGNSAYFNGPAATAFTPIFALYRNNLEVFRIDEYKSQFTGNVYMNSIVGPASSGITFQNQSGSGKLIHMVPTGGTLAIGYGTLTTAAALDVKAQGALSTDIAFRVRNSADTANLFDVQGDGITSVRTRIICGFSGMTSTGGALHVYAGNSSDNVARFFNTSGLSFLNIRTSSNGGVIELNDATGSAGVTLNGIFSNAITLADSRNIVFGTGAGTKIASATNQKFAFWNATPIVQPTTAVTASTFVTNTSGILNDSATFDGYTIGQVVKALRNLGILA
jgi:hypothetical protein